jgi:hypothetical protein
MHFDLARKMGDQGKLERDGLPCCSLDVCTLLLYVLFNVYVALYDSQTKMCLSHASSGIAVEFVP